MPEDRSTKESEGKLSVSQKKFEFKIEAVFCVFADSQIIYINGNCPIISNLR